MKHLSLESLQKDLQIAKKKVANIKALLIIPCSANAKKVLLKELEETVREKTIIEIFLQQHKN
jgi:hypothetical protein